MNQTGLDDWITVAKDDIPHFLRSCPYFLTLGDHEQTVKVPRKCYRPNLSVYSGLEVKQLLFTMQFWGLKALPQELVMFFVNHPELDLNAIIEDFTNAFDFVEFLKALCSSLEGVSYLGQCTGLYLNQVTLDRQGGLLPDVLSLLKLQFQYYEGKVWNSKTCSLAARMGWLDCLEYLHELGCPWDGTTCSEAARHNHLSCLVFAHTHGCPWNKETPDSALHSRSFVCYQFARDNGCPVGKSTSAAAASTGMLAILQDLHESGCPWDANTCTAAAGANSIDCLRYAREHGCRWNTETCAKAAGAGSMDCLMYAREHRCPWDEDTCSAAAGGGNLSALAFAHKNGCPLEQSACERAAAGDHLDCLQYVRDRGCPWTWNTFSRAAERGSLDCIQYARANSCPWNREMLHYLVDGGHVACIKFVIDSKCPGHARLIDYAGKSLSVLRYLHEECHQPLTTSTARIAARHSSECLQYCLDHGCPVTEQVMGSAAQHLDRIKLLRAHGCAWDSWTLYHAVPNLDCMRYLLENGCPGVEQLDKEVLKNLRVLKLAHSFGFPLLPAWYMHMPPMECVQFLHEQGVPWPPNLCRAYAYHRNVECLRYALEHGTPCDASVCAAAVSIPFSRFYAVKLRGWHAGEREYYLRHQQETLASLKCLREHGCPWDARTTARAARCANKLCLEYALANGCPRSWLRDKLAWLTGRNTNG